MGVIKRQGFKQSIVSYTGVLISAFATIYIYPQDKEIYGFAQFLLSAAFLISPFMLLGSTSVSTRFFPDLKDDESDHHGLWSFIHILAIIGMVAVSLLLVLFNDSMSQLFKDKAYVFQSYTSYIIIIGVLVSILQLNINYCANFKRTAVPSIFQLFIKVSLPVLVWLFYVEIINLEILIWGIIVNYLLTVVGVFAYLWWLGELRWSIDFSYFTKDRLKAMGKFAAYGMLAGIGGVMALRIDSFMVPLMTDFQQNGIYNISIFMGNAIAIPSTALLAISAPLVADSLQKQDYEHIKDIYQRGSINLLWIGILLFCLVVLNVEDLFSIMPSGHEMKGGFVVVVLIGLAKVIEMATSTNHQIIGYSQYYHYNLYLILLLAVFNIFFNWLLIPIYGIAGAALATAISILIYNLIKVVFIYWKFGFLPFTKSTVYLCVLGGVILGTVYGTIYSLNIHPILAIGVKSIIIVLIYLFFAIKLKISPDMNELIIGVFDKVKQAIGRK